MCDNDIRLSIKLYSYQGPLQYLLEVYSIYNNDIIISLHLKIIFDDEFCTELKPQLKKLFLFLNISFLTLSFL